MEDAGGGAALVVRKEVGDKADADRTACWFTDVLKRILYTCFTLDTLTLTYSIVVEIHMIFAALLHKLNMHMIFATYKNYEKQAVKNHVNSNSK